MQLTRIDRWLKETFVYETHILTLRPTEKTPKKMRRVDLEEKPGRRFKHLYITDQQKVAEAFLNELKNNNRMFSTKVVDKDAWWVDFVAPEGKSPTWYVVSVFLLMAALSPVVIWIRSLIRDPEFMKNFLEAVDLFKG
jgi:hypothetical protein